MERGDNPSDYTNARDLNSPVGKAQRAALGERSSGAVSYAKVLGGGGFTTASYSIRESIFEAQVRPPLG